MKVYIYVRLEWGESWNRRDKDEIQSALFECGCYRIHGWTTGNNVYKEGYGAGNWNFTTVGLPRVNHSDFESKFKSHPALTKCSFVYEEE